jgi:acetyl esterase/lipase
MLALGSTFGLSTSPLAAEFLQSDTATAPSTSKDFSLVDPELRSAVKAWQQIVLTPELLAQARKTPLLAPLPAPMPQPVDRTIPGHAGSPDVHIVIVDPAPEKKNKPVLLHTHGGGYVLANTALYPFIQNIAQQCHCVVVSVDYRMAPDTHFPGSLEDNYAALRWVYANAAMLGVDRARIAVGGESAGGGHAAALAIRARDRGEVPVIFQVLLYPMLDDRTGSSRAVPPAIGRFIWNVQCNRFGWSALLGVPAGSVSVPAGSVPARVENLAGLPPAWIGVGSIDLFVEEDIEYARRLIQAGVSTELAVYPGGYHAFDLIVPAAAVSKRFTESWMSALRRAFATA